MEIKKLEEIKEILEKAYELDGSDIHLVVGKKPMIRVNGGLADVEEFDRLLPDHTMDLAKELLTETQFATFLETSVYDFSFGVAQLGRYRVNIHRQRGTVGISMRVLNSVIPSFDDLKLPDTLKKFTEFKNGLVLITGPTGSGKSTTLAAMIDKINSEESVHIITIEDPIEYLYKHNKSLVEQMEIGTDVPSFKKALKYTLRQDPDIILVGELRDLDTIDAAITASETGHLVFATLHTNNAAKSIDRLIDSFPHDRQEQIRTQLSTSLRGVVAQQLLPTKDGEGRIIALEIMVGTPAIGNLIREGKTHQIPSIIQTGGKFGMITMEKSVEKLFEDKIINEETYKKGLK